jgi:probable phosphoglycerate mutase
MSKSALIFFRHGDVFEKDQEAVWAGGNTDRPLTKAGLGQAVKAFSYIERQYSPVLKIISSPLQQARLFAETLAVPLGLTISLDERLREIRFGAWEGLRDIEVRQRFGNDPIEQWEQCGTWPMGMDWTPSQKEIRAELSVFLSEQNKALTESMFATGTATYHLAVTSGGILREIYSLVSGKMCDLTKKVRPGNACILTPDGDKWIVTNWNLDPAVAKIYPL